MLYSLLQNPVLAGLAWRGMVIKDGEGDWAVCVAGWAGRRAGVPGSRGKPGRPGSHGSFVMVVNYLRSGETEIVMVKNIVGTP